MKIPDRVRLNGVEYRVESVPNLREGNQILYGQIRYGESRILLSSTDGAEHQRRCITLWHELLHGLLEGMELPEEQEEKLCETLARGVYQILQDNGGRLFDLCDSSKCPALPPRPLREDVSAR